MSFWPADWSEVLLPSAPIAELFVRASAIYFFLYILMRTLGRRLSGRFAISDILVMLLIAVAVRNGITGGHLAVGDAMICGATILAWDLGLDRLAFRSPTLRGVLRHKPVRIIDDGVLLVGNARDHLLTRAEIMEKLREQGVSSFEQVRRAHLEPDGSFSVVKR